MVPNVTVRHIEVMQLSKPVKHSFHKAEPLVSREFRKHRMGEFGQTNNTARKGIQLSEIESHVPVSLAANGAH